MKFGIHDLMSCADGQSAQQRYRDVIEQAVRAEALGFDSVWPVEQHFNARASVLPCPTLLLAAIAERTRTLRLGTAVVQLPLNHPVRVAEEIATLDVLSRGRVELGVGRGSNPNHFAGFGVNVSESRARFVEALDLIGRLLGDEQPVTFQGRFHQIENLALSPRPVQRPRPLMRIAANSAETAEFAGRGGYPVFFATNINPLPVLRELVPLYRRAQAAAGHAETPDDISIVLPLYVGESAAQIRADVEPSVRNFAQVAASALGPAVAKHPPGAERTRLEAIVARLGALDFAQVNAAMGIYDTPEACVERLGALAAELRPGRIITWFNFGGLVPHAQVLRSMEIFAARVMPRLASA